MTDHLNNVTVLHPCDLVELTPSQFIRMDTWSASAFCRTGRASKNLGDAPYSVHGGTTLADNDELRRENAIHAAAATTLTNGQIVIFNGRVFKVVVIRGNEKAPRNSDPIRFAPAKYL
jgi:hypothetical protein